MKKFSKYVLVMILALLLVFALAACDTDENDGDNSKDIKITVSQSGATAGIAEYVVRKAGQTEALSMGDNTLTVTNNVQLEVSFRLEAHYQHALKINGASVTVVWTDDTASYTFSANADTTIDLSVVATFHNVTVKIEDNTDGHSGFVVKYKDEEQSGQFVMPSYEAFKFTRLSTDSNDDYRFITTVDCSAYGGINSNSEGLSLGDELWRTINLSENDSDVITIKVDIEYKVTVYIANVPTAIRPNIKVIAIDSRNVPSGVVLPLEVIEYGTVITANQPGHIDTISHFIPKGMMIAVVVYDEEGTPSFFQHETVDGESVTSGLHTVTDKMALAIDSI